MYQTASSGPATIALLAAGGTAISGIGVVCPATLIRTSAGSVVPIQRLPSEAVVIAPGRPAFTG